MGYLQVSLTVEMQHADKVSDLLGEYGAFSVTHESASQRDCYDAAVPLVPAWPLQKLTALFASDACSEAVFSGLSTCILNSEPIFSRLEDEDWERRWLDQFQPIKVGSDLWVCPSWKQPPDPEATNIIIDPGLAFGTGTHPTTQLCLQYLSETPLSGKTVIDYGCGSGILAIAALALGAEGAIGIDVDQKALQASLKNAEINRVSNRFQISTPDLLDSGPVDIVIANILCDTLIELRKDIIALTTTNSVLLLSGILAHQEQQVLRHYRQGFSFTRIQNQDWLLLAGVRNDIEV